MTLNTRNVEGHIETTAFSQKVCFSYANPNKIAKKLKRDEGAVHEVDKFRSTASQKNLLQTRQVRQSRNI